MRRSRKAVGDCPYGWEGCTLGAASHSPSAKSYHTRWAKDPSFHAECRAVDRRRKRKRREVGFRPIDLFARAAVLADGRSAPDVFCRETVAKALSRWGVNPRTVDGYMQKSEMNAPPLSHKSWTCDYSFLPDPRRTGVLLNFKDHRVWSAAAVRLSARFAPGRIFSRANRETADWSTQQWNSLLGETAHSNPSPLQAAINDGAGIVASWRLLQRVVGSMTQKASEEGAAHA